jgi:hypothetical protein
MSSFNYNPYQKFNEQQNNRYNNNITQQPSYNVNTSHFYSNKESWNNKQFERNTENHGLYRQNFTSYQDAMNITFSENYKNQRQEAFDVFNKRNMSDINYNQPAITPNNTTKSNAKLGIVDFQDDQYRQYLMNKDIKK